MNKPGIIYYHTCSHWPELGLRKVRVLDGWHWDINMPELNGANYKPCCKFFIVNPDDSVGEEVDLSEDMPHLKL